MPLLIAFDLLDRQIVDRDGVPVGKVDDVELSDDGRYVTALLTGQRALGARFGGRLGHWITATATRLDIDRLGPRRIEYALVARVDSAVHLSTRRELLAPPALEAWLDEHLISKIPGASDAG
ncbi:MAG TPA: PRC-barrel domain-containing protein [Actinoplanes sp.]|jgi:sporulation protein YlmC with PRC-barrel domain